MNLNPSFVGSAGLVANSPFLISCVSTVLPPLESKVTVTFFPLHPTSVNTIVSERINNFFHLTVEVQISAVPCSLTTAYFLQQIHSRCCRGDEPASRRVQNLTAGLLPVVCDDRQR